MIRTVQIMSLEAFFFDFKRFLSRRNVIDLAVAVIMGTASKAMIDSIVSDIITPIIGIFLGGVNFKKLSITLGNAHIMYGAFIQAAINFLLIAIIIFFIIRNLTKLESTFLGKIASEPKPIPDDVKLLTEIRDLLKR